MDSSKGAFVIYRIQTEPEYCVEEFYEVLMSGIRNHYWIDTSFCENSEWKYRSISEEIVANLNFWD